MSRYFIFFILKWQSNNHLCACCVYRPSLCRSICLSTDAAALAVEGGGASQTRTAPVCKKWRLYSGQHTVLSDSFCVTRAEDELQRDERLTSSKLNDDGNVESVLEDFYQANEALSGQHRSQTD